MVFEEGIAAWADLHQGSIYLFELQEGGLFREVFLNFIDAIVSYSRPVGLHHLEFRHSPQHLLLLVIALLTRAHIHPLPKHELDVVLGKRTHVPEVVQVIEGAHQPLLEFIKLLEEGISQTPEGLLKLRMGELVQEVDIL